MRKGRLCRIKNLGGVYLPPFNFRCLDMILRHGCQKVGVPYLPDRLAQLTEDHNGHPACHYCGDCTFGCEVGAFFSSPWFLLPAAGASGNLELKTNAIAKNILVDDNGHASGVAYLDRESRQEYEIQGRAVVVAASCIESARIMLNSKSRHWPNGIANSSGQLGRNLCDHLYATTASGYLPQLLGQPSFPDNVGANSIAWMPRWQNLEHAHERHARLSRLGIQPGCMGTRHCIYDCARHQVDVAALFRGRRKNQFLGTEFGALR